MRRALLALLCCSSLAVGCGRGDGYGVDRVDDGTTAPIARTEIDRIAIVPETIVAFVGEETPIEVWGRFLGGWRPLVEDGSLGFTTDGEAFRFNGIAVQGLAEGTGVLRVTRGRLTAEAPVVIHATRRATAIAIGPAPLVLSVGGQEALRVIATFDDGTAAPIDGDPQLALSVTGDAARLDGATLVGVAPGEARVTATWQGLQSFLGVRVIQPERELVALEVTPAQVALERGETLRLTVTGWLSDGSAVDLSRASSGTSYRASRNGVLEDRGDGLFFAVGAGETELTVTNGAFAAFAFVQVGGDVERRPVQLLVDPPELKLVPGEAAQLQVTILFDDGSAEDATSAFSGTVYSSDDTAPVFVSPDGFVQAFAPGEGRIGVRNGTLETIVHVLVEGDQRTLIGFGLNPDRLELSRGESAQIMAIGTWSDGSQEDLACESFWDSSDRRVADVSQGCGVLFARRPGEAIVTAFSPDGAFAAELRVSVLRAP